MFYSTSIYLNVTYKLLPYFCDELCVWLWRGETERDKRREINTWPTHTTQDLFGNTGLLFEENSWNCWRFVLVQHVCLYFTHLEFGFLEMSASLSHKQNMFCQNSAFLSLRDLKPCLYKQKSYSTFPPMMQHITQCIDVVSQFICFFYSFRTSISNHETLYKLYR